MPTNSSNYEQEFLDKFAEIFNEENPNHTYTRQELNGFAWNVVNFVRLTYKPIPKDKQAEFEKL